MSSEIFNDESMLEIFRAEVETHSESLTAGLLALERDPRDTSRVDEMMRAAHSIKGAGRILGIVPAVRVSHVMEDCFVAAQERRLTLRPDHVDVLLRGVDMLIRLKNNTKASVDWSQFNAEVEPLVAELAGVLSGKSTSAGVTIPAAAAVPAAPALVPDVVIVLPVMLDAANAESARIRFIEGLDSLSPVVRFDLSLTRDLDAVGIALLAAAPACASGTATRVELVGANADLQVVLQVTGIDQLYSVGSCP